MSVSLCVCVVSGLGEVVTCALNGDVPAEEEEG